MDQDLVTPENLSVDSVRAILDAALMETSIDKDGDLFVREGAACFVLVDEDKTSVRLFALVRFVEGSGREKQLELANNVNTIYKLVRAYVGESNSLRFDYHIEVKGGITKRALASAVKRFLSILPDVIREYGSDLVA